MSYWFRDDIEAFARPVSVRFECGDHEILARIITCEVMS
jgi:hypothetical protein